MMERQGLERLTSTGEVCSPRAWNFSRMEELWKQLAPLTPYGRDVVARRIVYADPEVLLALYDDADAYGRYSLSREKGKATLDKLAWHLGRIPRLPSFGLSEEGFGLVELFLFKKFLSNYKACFDLLDDEARNRFGFRFSSSGLEASFAQGGSDPETFQISERYDGDLKRVREEIAAAGEELGKAKESLANSALAVWGLDFKGRDFLTLPLDEAMAIASRQDSDAGLRISVEPYDDYACLVRILPDASLFTLERRREALRDEERMLEGKVMAGLSGEVLRSRQDFEDYSFAIERLDLARCRYVLARKHDMRRPDFGREGIEVERGRFLPLLNDCDALGTRYFPVDVAIRHPAAVLFGSNMGGKTVALQSLLFFQIAAQSGISVPAARFSSKIFEVIEYVGEGPDRAGKGLSSFGREISALSAVLEKTAGKSCLAAFDEFAHTTSSEEAEALLDAVIHRFSTMRHCLVLFATHFRGIARRKGICWLRMAGLDRGAAREVLAGGAGDPGAGSLEDRLRSINRLMRYEIAEDSGGGAEGSDRSDALEVASLLGLDPVIVDEATRNLEKIAKASDEDIRS